MLKTKGLTEEQRTMAKEMLGSLGEAADGVKAQIKSKIEKTEIKIKAQAGLSEEQMNQLREAIRAGDENAKLKIVGKKIREKLA